MHRSVHWLMHLPHQPYYHIVYIHNAWMQYWVAVSIVQQQFSNLLYRQLHLHQMLLSFQNTSALCILLCIVVHHHQVQVHMQGSQLPVLRAYKISAGHHRLPGRFHCSSDPIFQILSVRLLLFLFLQLPTFFPGSHLIIIPMPSCFSGALELYQDRSAYLHHLSHSFLQLNK